MLVFLSILEIPGEFIATMLAFDLKTLGAEDVALTSKHRDDMRRVAHLRISDEEKVPKRREPFEVNGKECKKLRVKCKAQKKELHNQLREIFR